MNRPFEFNKNGTKLFNDLKFSQNREKKHFEVNFIKFN